MPEPTPIPQLTPEQVRDISIQIPSLPVLYFNHARIVSSNFDIRIYFGQGNITAQGQQTLVEQLCVILTPEFAATFLESLKATLERFQERFGALRPAPQEATVSLPAGAPSQTKEAKATKKRH